MGALTARRLQIAALLLCAGALALRLLLLDDKSFWPDEGSSYYFSQLPLSTLLWKLCDPHPPGYYLLLRLATWLGASEAWLRMPSVLAGVLAVPLAWALTRTGLGPLASPRVAWKDRAALLAAALVACAPLLVWYSVEARSYTLATALSLGMALAGLRWWRRRSRGNAMLYLLVGWTALFVEYTTLVVWAGLTLFLVSGWPWHAGSQGTQSRPGRVVDWLVLQLALLGPFVARWLVSPQRVMVTQMSYPAVFLAVQAQVAGLTMTPDQARRLIASVLLVVTTAALVFALVARRSPRMRSRLGSSLVTALLVSQVLVLAVAGVVPRLYTLKRQWVVVVPLASLFAAWALFQPKTGRPPRDGARYALAIILVAACLSLSLIMVVTISKPPWREAVQVVASELGPGDSVWVDELDLPVFDYYWRGRSPREVLTSTDLEALNNAPVTQRVWLIGGVSPYRNLHETLPAAFARHRVVARRFDWPGVTLVAYDHTTEPQEPRAPSQALLWGLAMPSPLETGCSVQNR